jgi:glycosyltransferase involved in cell wall biosynthesis
VSTDHDDTDASPHTLAGATVLQIVPALREEPVARTALIVAAGLLQAGTRALVAGEDGPLAAELQAFGGEFIPLVNATANPLKLRRGARQLEGLIAAEHIDIVHAQSIGGAWIASLAAAKVAVWLVTTLPDLPAAPGLRAYWAGALARGDRVIASSNYAAAPVAARYGLPRERIAVVPRSIDTATFDPAAVASERIEALRKAWRIPHDARILLVPGRVAPFNGQLILPEVARALLDAQVHGFIFVLAGEHRSFAKYARSVADEAKAKGTALAARALGGSSASRVDFPVSLSVATISRGAPGL